MGVRSFDDEIAQVPSRDRADRYFAPNNAIAICLGDEGGQKNCSCSDRWMLKIIPYNKE